MRLTYRTKIDSLKAITIGAVALYHDLITIFGLQLIKGNS